MLKKNDCAINNPLFRAADWLCPRNPSTCTCNSAHCLKPSSLIYNKKQLAKRAMYSRGYEECIIFLWVNISWKENNQNKGSQIGGLFNGISPCIHLTVRTHASKRTGISEQYQLQPAASIATQVLALPSGQHTLYTATTFYIHLHVRGKGSLSTAHNWRGTFNICPFLPPIFMNDFPPHPTPTFLTNTLL